MVYVIAEPCIGCKNTACVEVCPPDCIHPRKDEPEFSSVAMLYVDPEGCVDCGACEDACPVQAVFSDEALPPQWANFAQINADWYTNRA